MSLLQRAQTLRIRHPNHKSISIGHEIQKKFLKDEEVVLNFMTLKDVPGWYRGISQFQKNAASNLLNAIRDDAEQRTSHRVRNCLSGIGLTPNISAMEAKQLMRLSRLNDLAFLWFLYELHYRTDGPEYSVNEQLILSSIVHLDMTTTLRELDRILPPGHLSKKDIESQRKKEDRKKKQELKAMRRKSAPHRVYSSPYFQPLVHPIARPANLTSSVPDFSVIFNDYQSYLNPSHIVQNESNRWFANYDLNPAKRVTTRIINEEIHNIFEDFAAATLRADTIKSLCEHHKVIEKLEKSLEFQLKEIARQRCEMYFGKDKEERRQQVINELETDIRGYLQKFRKLTARSRQQCVIKRLNTVVEDECRYLIDDIGEKTEDVFYCVLGDKPKKPDEKINLLKSKPQICKPKSTIQSKSKIPRPKNMIQVEKRLQTPLNVKAAKQMRAELKQDVLKNKPSVNLAAGDNIQNTVTSVEKCTEDIGDGVRKQKLEFAASATETKRASKVSRCSNLQEFIHKYTSKRASHLPVKIDRIASEKFFEATHEHRPFKFDYSKIFQFKQSGHKTLNIKRALADAINEELENFTKSSSEQEFIGEPLKLRDFWQKLKAPFADTAPELDIDDAIRHCVKKVWNKEVARKNIELAEQEARHRKAPVQYFQDHYNADDKKLMNNMLKDSLAHMSHNKKYVLAAMPDAHKLPYLREWIRQRYGKKYTRKERFLSYQMSLRIFKTLDMIVQKVQLPNRSDIGRELFSDYSCHDYLLKKVNYISLQSSKIPRFPLERTQFDLRQLRTFNLFVPLFENTLLYLYQQSEWVKHNFYNKVANGIMEQSRVFWFAMRPFMCSNGPPINTYFAYMPSRVDDIQHFRIWQPNEFMNAKGEWERRNCEIATYLRNAKLRDSKRLCQ